MTWKFLNFLSGLLRVIPSAGRVWLLGVFRSFPGKPGIVIRYIIAKYLFKKCGINVSIHSNVYQIHLKNIEVGSNVSVHPFTYIDGYGGIVIGSNVSIAHNVSLLTTEHTWNNIDIPIKYNSILSKNVSIGDDVWIGCGVRILSGTTIGSRVVVGAGAVVNKDILPKSLAVGVPVKVVKKI